MNNSKITYIFPSRSRPEKFFNCIENIKSLSESDNYEIISVLDLDDLSMNNYEVKNRFKNYQKIIPYYGLSNSKIHAINRELKHIDGKSEIICLMSDDMFFLTPGFDNEIRGGFFGNFKGLLHFPDGYANDRLCTLPILHKEYLAIDGWIYHPKFYSVYPDNLQQDLAKKRKRYRFLNNQIFEHRHYRWKLSEEDDLYKRNDNQIVYAQDLATYIELKKEFGIV